MLNPGVIALVAGDLMLCPLYTGKPSFRSPVISKEIDVTQWDAVITELTYIAKLDNH